MPYKLASMLCIGITLTGCASTQQVVPAPCPKLPTPPAVLMQTLPTLILLPPAPVSAPSRPATSPSAAP